MRGNSAVLKCLIPSFVADFVYVDAWINEEGNEILGGGDFEGGNYSTLPTALRKHFQTPSTNPVLLFSINLSLSHIQTEN